MQNRELLSTPFMSGTSEKLLMLMIWLCLAVGPNLLMMQSVLLVCGLVILFFKKGKQSASFKVMLLALPFIVIASVGVLFEMGSKLPNATFQFNTFGLWWNITPGSLQKSMLLMLKAVNGLCILQFAVRNFSYHESITVAKRLHLPPVLIEMIVLSYRYLHGVQKTASEVMMAQRQRMGYQNLSTSVNSFSLMLSAVFVRSLRFSIQNNQAMGVRAYNGTLYLPEEWHRSSVLGFASVVVFSLFFISLSFL
ncbi:energy-coupling factor transporter transmembrane component T family protein [Carboxylicivirga marina]|uniref:Cobalt ECF transporter T component CbiQ n=1 Tax=Carboxylicivirga marina TaxID=2800988 RepID=A0ABS1HKS7_9BACT|nr:energy-coupling factor transporter transmembrane component T [Carboxylicivirga marina]MBK3518070.1 hypothetical protein [Carboxylicivirga marina]